MQKYKKILISFLSILILLVFLVSCQSSEVSSITIKGYQANFTVGDTFNYDGLLVEATTSDGNQNVSDLVEIDSSQVDMSKPGVYAVVVKYQNIEKPYYITVEAMPNEQRLKSLAVDTTNAKTTYLVGEKFTSENLAVIATYQNSNDTPDTVKYLTDLADFTIIIRDKNNNNAPETFTSIGEYTVFVTQGTIRASYVVNVVENYVDISSAISMVDSNKGQVARGTAYNKITSEEEYTYKNNSVIYEFGTNLVSLEYGNNYECYSLNDGIVSGYKVDKTSNVKENLTDLDENNLEGVKYTLGFGSINYYGAENFLKGLYSIAINNSNYDFKESVINSTNDDGSISYIYNFSFSILEERKASLEYYLHQIEVTFRLDSTGILSSLIVESSTYVVNNRRTDFMIYPLGEANSQAFYDPNRVLPGNNYPSDFPVITSDYQISDCMARLKQTAKPYASYYYQITQIYGERNATSLY